MVELEIDKIANLLKGINTSVNDNLIYLNDIYDLNEFLKLLNAIRNIKEYKINPNIKMDISNYLNGESHWTTTYDNACIITNIHDLNIIYAICGYLSIQDTNEEFHIYHNQKEVREIIKKFVDKNNFEKLSKQIKIIS